MKTAIWALLTTIVALFCAIPAHSKDAPATKTANIKELWRVGGDSEDEGEVFGSIWDITVDTDGNVYILDGQAVEVRMFSRDGTFVRAIGREGEGPGEFRMPMGIVTLPGHRIGVYQSSPPRVALFDGDGNSAGDLSFEFDPGHEVQYLSNVQCGPDSFVITGVYAQNDDQGLDRIIRTMRFDLHGKYLCELSALKLHTDFQKPVTTDERQSYVKCGPSGRAYIADSWNYKIQACDPNCQTRTFVDRAYDHHRRSGVEIDRITEYYRRGSGNARLDISKFDPDVRWMGVDASDRLWVLPSDERAVNSLGRFDVYDAHGTLMAQVDLKSEATAKTDRYFLLGDRMFVLRHNGGDEKDLEAPGVVCYQLPGIN